MQIMVKYWAGFPTTLRGAGHYDGVDGYVMRLSDRQFDKVVSNTGYHGVKVPVSVTEKRGCVEGVLDMDNKTITWRI